MRKLAEQDLQRFQEDGYLVVEGVLDQVTDIDPIFDEYSRVLDELANSLSEQRVIDSTFADLAFCDRLIAVSETSGRSLGRYFSPTLPEGGILHDTPMHLGPAVFGLLTNPKVLDLVEDMIGPEIYVNPLHHMRLKLPPRAVPGAGDGLIGAVPWHQDSGVLQADADDAAVLTVWIPITEATVENGALEVIPGSHRGDRDVMFHCPAKIEIGFGPYIPDHMVAENRVPVPMKVGSILLLHKRVVHRSLDNTSENDVRLSFDLRYQRVGEPTGRPGCPGFVARSEADPDSALRDWETWAHLWLEARDQLAEDRVGIEHFFRWTESGLGCA